MATLLRYAGLSSFCLSLASCGSAEPSPGVVDNAVAAAPGESAQQVTLGAPLPAEPCKPEAPPIGKRVLRLPSRTVKNAGAPNCRLAFVELGPALVGSRPVLSASQEGVLAAWFEDQGTVVARFLSSDLAPTSKPVKIGRFSDPKDVVAVALSGGGLVLTRSVEADGDHWFASFLDANGRVVGPPVATALDPQQVLRTNFVSDVGTVHLVQYPMYLPGNAPSPPKPVVSHLLSKDKPNVCPVRVELGGVIDSRHEVVAVQADAGPGFLLRFLEGDPSALPPPDQAKVVLVRHASTLKDPAAVVGGASGPGRLELIPQLGTTKYLRAAPAALGAVTSELAPPIDLAPLLGGAPLDPAQLGEVLWTGKQNAVPVTVAASGQARFIQVDCK
jgi:hypothetical protein